MTMRTLTLVACLATVQSFAILPSRNHPSAALYLVPSQADQLVAASSLIYKEDEDEELTIEDTTARTATKKEEQSFVSRLFSLPASFRHPHRTENEVVYPVIGFQYVEDPECPEQYRVLPTVSNASCRLPAHEEDTFGWYTPVVPQQAESDDGTHQQQ